MHSRRLRTGCVPPPPAPCQCPRFSAHRRLQPQSPSSLRPALPCSLSDRTRKVLGSEDSCWPDPDGADAGGAAACGPGALPPDVPAFVPASREAADPGRLAELTAAGLLMLLLPPARPAASPGPTEAGAAAGRPLPGAACGAAAAAEADAAGAAALLSGGVRCACCWASPVPDSRCPTVCAAGGLYVAAFGTSDVCLFGMGLGSGGPFLIAWRA